MFVIYNRDEGLYLMGTQKNGLGILTCLWGIDVRDAITFASAIEARLVLRRIGPCDAVVKRVQAGWDGV